MIDTLVNRSSLSISTARPCSPPTDLYNVETNQQQFSGQALRDYLDSLSNQGRIDLNGHVKIVKTHADWALTISPYRDKLLLSRYGDIYSGGIMDLYTIEQLSKPETYKNDKELFGMARRIAEARYSDRQQMLAYRDEIVAGEHPMTVHEHRVGIVMAQVAAFEKRNAAIETAKALQLPAGVTVTVVENEDSIHIATPWDGYDIAPRIKRLGGRWDRDAKAWIVPVESAVSLKRVFANWQKSQSDKAAEKAAADAERERRKAAAHRQREEQWAAEREANRNAVVAQKASQAKAVALRVLVEAGKYKIGDTLEGKPITGFGKSWTESDLSHGQLYQPCDWGRCDNEPVCVNCFKCAKHCSCGTQTTYCYAYFD